MSEINMEYSKNIYYSDTDSVYLDVSLPDGYISGDLGDFKFENKFNKVFYIAAKVYAATLDDNKEFIIIIIKIKI